MENIDTLVRLLIPSFLDVIHGKNIPIQASIWYYSGMKLRPTNEEISRDYDLWAKYVHDEIPEGEFHKMTVREKLEIIAGMRPEK